MSVYAIAQLSITDRAAMDAIRRWVSRKDSRGGRLLAADECPVVLEGTLERDKVVLLSFPDEAAYREWAESPDHFS